jgi:hypothetical protein
MARPRYLGARSYAPFIARGRGSRAQLMWVVLLAFALRALIPIGFMPAADGTLSLTICDEGFPAGLLPPAAHGRTTAGAAGHRSQEDHCPFCGASTPAPGPLFAALACVVWVAIETVALVVSCRALIRLLHVPQARAPPAFT